MIGNYPNTEKYYLSASVMTKNKNIIFVSLLMVLLPMHAQAQDTVNSGDTAWMLVATAMVMLMTPAGLALFYGGLTRSKSVLNTIGMSYVGYCAATLVWIVAGYSLVFGGDGAWIGSLDHLFLGGIAIDSVTGTIPTLLFVAFQGTFAAITVAIVSGSIIERIKFSTWIVFAFLWTLVVYSPIAHWVWGGGFLSGHGELDFAGGTVIHINAGVAGLVLLLLLGKRKDFVAERARPSSLKLTILGSALLWFGWFGFNAGSALVADGIAANALLVTNVAACAAGMVWLICELIDVKRSTLMGLASGVVAGLVAITPAAGYVDVSGALAIGVGAGLIGYFCVVKLKSLLRYDDTLDAFGLHGMVGIFGAIATGIFANPAINGAAGLLYGNPSQVGTQLIAVLATIAYSAVGTFIVYKISALITGGGRVTEREEDEGMDAAMHGEAADEFDN
jgi:Amt family ammonium transporter